MTGRKEGVNREPPHGSKVETSRFLSFEPAEWERGRYGEILKMVRRGACNEEIMDTYPGVDDTLCEVYRKIVSGTTANFSSQNMDARIGGNVAGKVAMRRQTMLAMYAGGMSVKEIVIETGMCERTVREALFGDARGGSD